MTEPWEACVLGPSRAGVAVEETVVQIDGHDTLDEILDVLVAVVHPDGAATAAVLSDPQGDRVDVALWAGLQAHVSRRGLVAVQNEYTSLYRPQTMRVAYPDGVVRALGAQMWGLRPGRARALLHELLEGRDGMSGVAWADAERR